MCGSDLDFAFTKQQAAVLDRLQAAAARAYPFSRTKSRPNWMTPKQTLNLLHSWESLAWRRQILSLLSSTIYCISILLFCFNLSSLYQYPSLLLQFKFTVSSSSSQRPTLVVLQRSGAHFSVMHPRTNCVFSTLLTSVSGDLCSLEHLLLCSSSFMSRVEEFLSSRDNDVQLLREYTRVWGSHVTDSSGVHQ